MAASSYKLWWFADIWQANTLPLSLALLTGAIVNFVARLALGTLAEQNGQRLVIAYHQALFSRMLDADVENGPNRLGVVINRRISDANSVAHFAGRGLGFLQMGALGYLCFGGFVVHTEPGPGGHPMFGIAGNGTMSGGINALGIGSGC